MAARHYPAVIEGDGKSGSSVFFPDLPGWTSGGSTLQEAALNAERALAGHIALMLEHGEPTPAASRLDDLPRPIAPKRHDCLSVSICRKKRPSDPLRHSPDH